MEKYFNFPIQLLQGFIGDSQKTLNSIVHYSVYKHSLKIEFGDDAQKMKDSASFYGITLGNVSKALKEGIILSDSIPEKSPMVGISKEMLFNFYGNEKADYEKICLLGFLAIKSILGTKDYCKTNNSLWLARMDGQPKAVIKKGSDKLKKCSNAYEILLSPEINKFANEYQTKKIKTELRSNWGLITYSRYIKGFYISFDITDSKGNKKGLNLKGLINVAETNRKSFKEIAYKQEEKALINEVLTELKTRP